MEYNFPVTRTTHPKPRPADEWTCSCGAKNPASAKFLRMKSTTLQIDGGQVGKAAARYERKGHIGAKNRCGEGTQEAGRLCNTQNMGSIILRAKKGKPFSTTEKQEKKTALSEKTDGM